MRFLMTSRANDTTPEPDETLYVEMAKFIEELSASGVAFEAVPDLCEMSARRDPGLAEIASGGEATIVACYPRAVQWLFNAAGSPLPSEVTVLNMRASAAPEVAAALGLAPRVETS